MERRRLDLGSLVRFSPAAAATTGITSLFFCLAVSFEPASATQPAARPLTATAIDSGAGVNTAASQPAAASARVEPQLLSDVQVASFQEVVPGKSSLEDVTRHLGPPARRATGQELTVLTYKIDPFEKVEVVVTDGIVDSVVVYLAQPNKVSLVASELGLTEYTPATITDVDGKLLGQAYPERGILLGFSPTETAVEAQVAQIAIEQIDADSFVYRAKFNRGHVYVAAIEDLLYAQKLNPNDAESHGLSGELLLHSGRFSDAAKHIERAVKLSDGKPEYRLLKAKLLAHQNRYAEAVAETKQVLNSPDVSQLTRADAHHHLGRLLSVAPVPNFKESLNNYTEAIKIADSLANDEGAELQVAAKRISFDSHLGVADNIARGPWKRNHEVSTKWVDRAAEIANELIESGDFDESLRWVLQQKRLSVLAGATSTDDPAPVVVELIELSKKLIAECRDPLFRARVQFHTGRALINAAQIQHWRRQADSALHYGMIGTKLLETSGKQRDASPEHEYEMGRAYFLVGSSHSILRRDHEQALEWFAKAEPKLRAPLPELFAYQKNVHGDRFISMGVSYWQAGKSEKAIQLTKQGIDILEEAVKSGIAKPSALKIPYGNYGNMQKQSGNDDEAQRYIQRAAKLESPTAPTTR